MNKFLKEKLNNIQIPVIFDYDGVLCEARWFEERINMKNETEEKLLEAMENGLNLKTQPIPFMIELCNSLKNDKYCLSHIHNNIEYNHKKSMMKLFGIPEDNLLYAKSVEDKIFDLEKIKEKYGRFIYIDDSHQALIKFENHFDEDVYFFHVSSLYV